jgi:hypothetical protein
LLSVILIVFFVNATRQAVSDKLLNAYKAGFNNVKISVKQLNGFKNVFERFVPNVETI